MNQRKKLFQIGEIAKKAGVRIQTIRYYEQRKLLLPKTRSLSKYRLYEETAIQTIFFIKSAQNMGFTLKEIKELLQLRISSPQHCIFLKKNTQKKLEEVQKKISFLKKIEQILQKLIRDCQKRKSPKEDCPILKALEIHK